MQRMIFFFFLLLPVDHMLGTIFLHLQLVSIGHRGNQANEGIHTHLKGFATCHGLTDIAYQYKDCTDYALNMSTIKKATHDHLNKLSVRACELAIQLGGIDEKIYYVAAYVVSSCHVQ